MDQNTYGGFQTSGAFDAECFETDVVVVELGPSVITFQPVSSNGRVTEGSSYYVNVAYYDIDGNPITPTMVQWRVWDDTNQVALQAWTTIPYPGTSNQLLIPESYNELGNPSNLVETREVIFRVSASGGSQRYDMAVYYVLAVDDIT
jgi:hypothetical protein